ncbi:MAG TPA: RsmB/NOP family class I SAM-dependent RNA methyltransferase [Verrucomicrobiae bacterium]
MAKLPTIEPDDLPSALLRVAAHVIQEAAPEKPADALLRHELKARKVTRADARDISKLVFDYYRWYGWLQHLHSLYPRIKLAKQLAKKFEERPESFTAESLQHNSVPAWIKEVMNVTPEWAKALQSPPDIWLRSRLGQDQSLREKLGVFEDFTVPGLPEAIRYDGDADLFRSTEFHAGEFELQDIASQMVGAFCAPKPGETWWDTCAGEGGKTLHLSDLLHNRGLIWATDRADWRLKKLKMRASRAKAFNYRTALWDGSGKLPTKTKFDGILIDAPCSGIGTWQRNPHARWTTTQKDVTELAMVQKQLLEHVAASVKPGGKLVYSVCTLSLPETSDVANVFTEAHPEFEPIAAPAHLTESLESSEPGQYWVWPQTLGGNGMFIAGWKRRKA